jgi:hypothetical protein
VHVLHVVSQLELAPLAETRLVSDPEDPTVLRPMDDEGRARYQARFAAWRADTARAWRLAGAAYREVVAEDDMAQVVRRAVTSAPERA